jgi:hypothetical protein
MAEQIKVKPGDGKRLRLENGTIVPTEGMEVTRSTYINRRIAVGDAIVVDVNESILDFVPERKRKN